MSKSYSERVARIRVPAGFFLGIVYVMFANPTSARLIWGSAIALVGLLLRAAGAGHLAKNQRLARNGPYRFMRHPLYIGSALAGIGFCVAGGQWWFFLLLGIFFAAVYWPVIRKEEAYLRRLFPEEYKRYRSIPFFALRPTSVLKTMSPQDRFSWQLYLKNREYQAFFAYLAIVLVLLSKMLLIAGT